MAEKKKRVKITKKCGKKQNSRGEWVADYRQFYGKTRKEAISKYEAYMKKQQGGLNASTCLGEFIQWYTDAVYLQDNSITEGTKALHLNSFRNVFADSSVLGRPLSEITGADLQAVLSASPCASTSKRHARSFLRRVFTYLEAERIVSVNITKGLIVPVEKEQKKQKSQEIETFTDEELKIFLEQTPSDSRIRLLIVLAIYSGARISELTALTYQDLENGQMRINKALKEIPPIQGSEQKTKAIITDTKTDCSVRTVPLEPRDYIQKEIDAHKKWHQAEQMAHGYRSEFVFTASSGELYFLSNLRMALKRLCKRLGIEPRGYHTFRHTYATRLAKQGVPITIVSKLLGHTSISDTAKYYVDVDAEMRRDAVKKLAIM